MVRPDDREMRRLVLEAQRAGPDEDPLSEWYERRLSRTDRRRTGQVYTPPIIAYLMARLCGIGKGDAPVRVLDPACGSGTFLRAVVLASDKGQRGGLDIHGYEPEEGPFGLAVLNLQALGVPQGGLVRGDFLASDPDGAMDIVIGNPPYIRQELLSSKDAIRAHVVGRYGGSSVQGRSDIYAYFIEHSTRALKDGGLLAFIVPDKWLDVGYGVQLKRFLLDNFRLRTVLGFDVNVFERAVVDSVIIIFERCLDHASRARTEVQMVRLLGPMPVDDIVGVVSGGRARASGRAETVRLEQGSLDPRSRWSHLIKAPSIFKEVMGSRSMVTLGMLKDVHVRRGVTTNLTRLFFPTEERTRALGIPSRFLSPAVKSPKSIDGLLLDEAPSRLLTIPERLTGRDLTALGKVLEWGDSREWGRSRSRVRDLPSFKRRGRAWYSVRTGTPGDIIVPKFVRGGRPRFIWNRAGAHVSDAFQTISIGKAASMDIEVLLGCLNSIVGALSCELVGRVEGRGLLQLMTYELANVPVPEISMLGRKAAKDIVRGYRTLVDDGCPDRLDRAVVASMSLGPTDRTLGRLVEAYDGLYEGRLSKETPSVPVQAGPR